MSTVVTRVDEVAAKYKPAQQIDKTCGLLFYVLIILSIAVLFTDRMPGIWGSVTKIAFLLLTLSLFALFVVNKLFIIPVAEKVRRKQLLANAFATPLTSENTLGYYNNGYPPSHQRLAANVMENAFFGKELTRLMLFGVRIRTFGYLLLWLACVAFRGTSMDVVLWISQLVFSADIIAYWLSLEILRSQHEETFSILYSHFIHSHQSDVPLGTASILDAFASYESSKSTAGVLLDSSLFGRHNQKLSAEWGGICVKVGIPSA